MTPEERAASVAARRAAAEERKAEREIRIAQREADRLARAIGVPQSVEDPPPPTKAENRGLGSQLAALQAMLAVLKDIRDATDTTNDLLAEFLARQQV